MMYYVLIFSSITITKTMYWFELVGILVSILTLKYVFVLSKLDNGNCFSFFNKSLIPVVVVLFVLPVVMVPPAVVLLLLVLVFFFLGGG